MSRLILGLDLGEASIGSAVVEVADDQQLLGIRHLGSRVFQSMLDANSKVPTNMARRAARGARKNRERKTRRRQRLRNALVRAGLLPSDPQERDLILGRDRAKEDPRYVDPYTLRKRALTEPLEPAELGRALVHLGQRRGFRSNKKARLGDLLSDDTDLFPMEEEQVDERDKEKIKEEKETLAQIQHLQDQLDSRPGLTLGAYLAERLEQGEKVRGLRTSREMYIREFEAIWQAQSPYHANRLTPALYREIRATFEQRPLKAPRVRKPRVMRSESGEAAEEMQRRVRNCRMFPEKVVARTDHFYAHRFRILQELRNLRYDGDDGEERHLTTEQVVLLAVRLQREKSLSWAEIKKALGLKRTTKFSRERDVKAEKGIAGNRTEVFFKEVLGDKWDDSLELPRPALRHQLEFMQDIDTAPTPHALFKTLQKSKANGNSIYPLTKEQAFKVADRQFSRKTGAYSARALRLLADELLRGAISTYHATRAVEDSERQHRAHLDRLPEPPFIPNPRVRRCLYEVRKVVNALIDEDMKPDEIRVELARDMKETEKDRLRTNKRQLEDQRRNEEAKRFYADHGITEPTREQIRRYKLWRECEERCPYTGTAISQADLLSERIEVDHILPLPRSGDDSFGNLVLTFRETNLEKGNRTPVEWLGKNDQAFQEAKRRFESMRNGAKIKRFLTEELEEDFTLRQLTDTRYACRAARQYLECLGIPVWVANGGATGLLRHEWELNGLIPIRATKKKLDEGAAKHRLDHRHHAIDALVVALTTPSAYRKALMHKRGMLADIAPPTPDFRQAAKVLVDRLLTSHDLDKGIWGALHDEMFYGRQEENGEARYVRRVPVRELVRDNFEKTMERLTTVYDDDLRARLVERLRAFGDPKEAFFLDEIELRDGAGRAMKIRTVRIRHRLGDAVVDLGGGRWTKPNSNHHAEIVRNRKGKLECRVVTMIDAARRIRSERRSPYGLTAEAGEELVMCLSVDEVVEYEGRPMRVVALSYNDLHLRDLNDARPAVDEDPTRLKGSDKFSALGRKRVCDVLGRLTPVDGP